MFKKQVMITVNNTYRYIDELLDFLEENDISGYKFNIFVEPKFHEDTKLPDLSILPEVEVFYNEEQKGVIKNPYEGLWHTFVNGSEFTILLEEDLQLSSDTFNLANFYYEEFKNQEKYKDCISGGLHWKESRDESCALHSNVFKLYGKHDSLGYCLAKWQWENFFKEHWMDGVNGKLTHPSGKPYTGQESISALLQENENLYSLVPRVTRTTHIGLYGGEHFRYPYHQKAYDGLVVNRISTNPEEFTIDEAVETRFDATKFIRAQQAKAKQEA